MMADLRHGEEIYKLLFRTRHGGEGGSGLALERGLRFLLGNRLLLTRQSTPQRHALEGIGRRGDGTERRRGEKRREEKREDERRREEKRGVREERRTVQKMGEKRGEDRRIKGGEEKRGEDGEKKIRYSRRRKTS